MHHDLKHAIIATYPQGVFCEPCEYRKLPVLQDCDHSLCVQVRSRQFGAMDMDQIRAKLREMGKSQTDLAHWLGIDATAVSKMLRGKRGISAREAAIISRELQIVNVGYSPTRELPVIGRVSAGVWREAIEEPIGTMPCPDDRLPLDAFVVEVDGDSMDLVVAAGGRVVIDPSDLDLVDKGTYIVRNPDGDTTFKRFMTDPARLEPCSSNPAYKTIFPGRDGFEVVGRAIWRFDRI